MTIGGKTYKQEWDGRKEAWGDTTFVDFMNMVHTKSAETAFKFFSPRSNWFASTGARRDLPKLRE
jgi:hypothetical protein